MTIDIRHLLCSTALGIAMCGTPAFAQEAQPESGGVQDIIVTAQRRGENLQNVPIAVTAIGGGELQSRGLVNPQALEGAVPSLTMS